MSEILYLLDEHVDPLFRTALLSREPELTVWRIGDPLSLPRGTLDPDILRWCEAYGFILVTNNRKSMPRHLRDHLAQDGHIPGIIEMNPGMTNQEIIEELLLIWGISTTEDYRDQIVYMPVLR